MKETIYRSTSGASTEEHYYSVLTRSLATIGQDPAQMRRLIYEFARAKLKKDLYQQLEEGQWAEIEQQARALETAIDRVESEIKHGTAALTFSPEPPLLVGPQAELRNSALVPSQDSRKTGLLTDLRVPISALFFWWSRYDRERTSALAAIFEPDNRRPVSRSFHQHLESNFWWTIELVAAAFFGLFIYVIFDGQPVLKFWNNQPQITRSAISGGQEYGNSSLKNAETSPAEKLAAHAIPDIPIPSAYGIYAISNKQLTELDVLPIKVPDPRIAVSASISTPSRNHLPVGPLQFIVYRRDLVSDAPDHVALRVVAQVVRSLTFDAAGKPSVTRVADLWVVRSNVYNFKVAPMPDKPDMIIIRPEDVNFVFPAGRYALVLKGVGYDFTLDGTKTDSAHCLERTDTLNFPVYTECREL